MFEAWSAHPEPATDAAGPGVLCTGEALAERFGAMVPGASLAEVVERLLAAAVPLPPAGTGPEAVTGEGTEATSGSFASIGAEPAGAGDGGSQLAGDVDRALTALDPDGAQERRRRNTAERHVSRPRPAGLGGLGVHEMRMVRPPPTPSCWTPPWRR